MNNLKYIRLVLRPDFHILSERHVLECVEGRTGEQEDWRRVDTICPKFTTDFQKHVHTLSTVG